MGGSIAYDVMVDGRRIGWVGDERPWRGHRYGGRRWWACWREEGDTVARWNTFEGGASPGLPTRKAALAALLAEVAR